MEGMDWRAKEGKRSSSGVAAAVAAA